MPTSVPSQGARDVIPGDTLRTKVELIKTIASNVPKASTTLPKAREHRLSA
jgi:hypothetical protein